MVDSKIISKSKAEWSFPMIVIAKKNKSLRLCIDYRQLNSVTHGDVYTMPKIDDVLEQFQG